MNILYIAHERNMGGASKCLMDMVCGMQKRGHRVYVVVPIKGCNVQKKLEEHGVTVIPIFFLWWEYPSYWKWYLKIPFRMIYRMENLAVNRIIKVIEQYHIDIVHSNSSVIDVGMRATQKCKVKHIWHFREFGDLDYQLEFFDGKRTCLNRIKQSGSDIIYISDRIQRYYQPYITDVAVKVIYDGIDTGYVTEKLTDIGEKIIFLTAGYLHRNKRQNLVLEAAHKLKNEGITDFEVWIAGKPSAMADSKIYTEELQSMAKDMLQQVKFLGFVEDMVALRKQTDIEIVPSAEEAFGRVTVEAMMAQMPVIGSDSGANPELIEDGVNGFLFESGSAEELAEQMKKAILLKGIIRQMGKAGQKRAIKEFCLENNLNQIEAFYRGE